MPIMSSFVGDSDFIPEQSLGQQQSRISVEKGGGGTSSNNPPFQLSLRTIPITRFG